MADTPSGGDLLLDDIKKESTLESFFGGWFRGLTLLLFSVLYILIQGLSYTRLK